jgi:hypothetical protein
VLSEWKFYNIQIFAYFCWFTFFRCCSVASRQYTTEIIYIKFPGIFFSKKAELGRRERKRHKNGDDRCTHCKRNEQNCRLVERESAIYFELIVFLFFINFMMLSKILPSIFLCVCFCSSTSTLKRPKIGKCRREKWRRHFVQKYFLFCWNFFVCLFDCLSLKLGNIWGDRECTENLVHENF